MSTFDDYRDRRKETLAIIDKRDELKRKQELDLQNLRNIPALENVKVDSRLANWTMSPTRQREKLATIDAQNRPNMLKTQYETSGLAHKRAMDLVNAEKAPSMLEAQTLSDYYKSLARPGDLTGSVRDALGIGATVNGDSVRQPIPDPSLPPPPAAELAVPRRSALATDESAYVPSILGPLPTVPPSAEYKRRKRPPLYNFATPSS